MRRVALIVAAVLAVAAPTVPGAASSSVASTAAERARDDVTLSAADPVTELGAKVRLRGTVDPGRVARGERVVIKKRLGERPWRVEGYARVRADGSFFFRDEPTTATRRTYRAFLPRTARHAADRSPRVHVAVARWRRLSRLDFVSTRFVSTTVHVTHNQVRYRSSLKSRFPDATANPTLEAWTVYDLAGNCFAMRSAVGLLDRSPAVATATFTLLLDGEAVTTVASPPPSTSTPVTADLTGAERARFLFTRPTPDVQPLLALLSPRFFCTDLP